MAVKERLSKSRLRPSERLMMEREYIDVKQLSAITGLAVGTVYNMVSARTSPPVYKFAGTSVRFLVSDVEAWLDRQRRVA
ncbi:helix-turn-helix transcriptional regulator [Lacisediminihabitans sp. FW035]